MGDEIGGHTVAGHVHTTARISSVQDTPENRTITFEVRGASAMPPAQHQQQLGALTAGAQVPPRWMKYIFSKGFIAVDGISLTVRALPASLPGAPLAVPCWCKGPPRAQVGEVTGGGFCVYLIPETLRVTNMGAKREGDTVNLEIDAQTQVRGSRPPGGAAYAAAHSQRRAQAIVDTAERVVSAHLERQSRGAVPPQPRPGQPQTQPDSLPHAHGQTAEEHGLPQPVEPNGTPLYA